MTKLNADIVLSNPRGFCAGVDRAIEIVERALLLFGAPIYVRHEIVHNRFVVEGLKAKGVIFVAELDQVPEGAVVVFSAHGVPQRVNDAAAQRDLTIFDATCPLVTKVHMEVARASRGDHDCILIGHANHPEVIGTMGQYHSQKGRMILVQNAEDARTLQVNDPNNLFLVTQTTLSVDETREISDILKERFPSMQLPKREDICYATQNRQDAVRLLAPEVDVVLVVGSANSSNSNRLRELSEHLGTPSYLLDSPDALKPEWFSQAKRIGVTAGASAPEVLVQQVIRRLQGWGAGAVRHMEGIQEDISFALPKQLRDIPVTVES